MHLTYPMGVTELAKPDLPKARSALTSSVRPRILFVQASGNRSGSTISGQLIVETLVRSDCEVDVVFSFDGPMVESYGDLGCRTCVIPHGASLRGGSTLHRLRLLARDLAASRKFVALLRRRHYDLVYANSFVSLAAVWAAHRRAVPCIWHLRELFRDVGGELTFPVVGGRPILRAAARHLPTQTVAISRAIVENVVGQTDDRHITILPNAIPDAFFKPLPSKSECRRKLGIPQNAMLVGVPATLRPVKGLEFFIDAAGRLARMEPDCQFAVTGHGPSEYTDQLIRRVDSAGITSRFRFLGSQRDMPAFYASCDLVCVPSRSESFGRSIVEAMAVGVPLVATKVGGIPEIIEHDRTGRLVEYGNVEQLADAMRDLLRDEDRRVRYSRAAREDAESRFRTRNYRLRVHTMVDDALLRAGRPGLGALDGTQDPRKPRVLFAQYSGNFSGSTLSGRIIVEALLQGGCQVDVVFASDGPMVSRYAELGCKTSILKHGEWLEKGGVIRCARRFARDAAATKQFTNRLADQAYDLVYVNSYVSAAAALAANRRGVPCVWHLRELFSDVGWELHYPAIGGRRLVRTAVRRLASQAVAISQAVANNVFPDPATSPVKVLHNAIEDSFFEPLPPKSECRRELELPAEAPLIGLPGTLRPVKGVAFFIDAAAQMARDDSMCHFAVTGHGMPEFREKLERKVASAGLKDRFHFLGAVTNMSLFYGSCDIACIPSRAEPFGRTVVEAMATGVPLVATRTGGIPEIIEHDRAGWLVDYGDVEQLTAALRTLLNDEARRNRYREAARKDAETRFRIDEYRSKICDLVDDVLRESGHPGLPASRAVSDATKVA